MQRLFSLLTITAAIAGLAACANRDADTAPNVLVSHKVGTPPVLDGLANDAA